ncbi:MAG: hypothetical protein RBU37_25155 [Myxococcota bacterium]|jgi:hypothetical protein|nr:hypothetical protein [Myxococcota bacterium]
MGYEVHIERRSADGALLPISSDEWSRAVAETEGVRLSEVELRVAAPRSPGDVVLPTRAGDAEVYFSETDSWHLVFVWNARGGAFFSSHPSFLDENNPVRRAARALAQKLGAMLVGDDGNRFD